MSNCKSDSPIPYDKYIDCSISTNLGLLADSLKNTVQIDLKNHSEYDLSLKYLYVQLNLSDSISGKFYGSTILEFSSKNAETYDIKNNSTVSISKNINELIWNSYIKTSELPASIYKMTVNVVTGDLDKSGSSIFSNVISIKKK